MMGAAMKPRGQKIAGLDSSDSDDVGAVRVKRAGKGKGRAARLDAVSKRFTPSKIDFKKCLARTWSDGYGGQCDAMPVANKTLCKAHIADLAHGYVT